MEELATRIENAWMTYNAAVVNRLHPEAEKKVLANILINNTPDIIKALRAMGETPTPTETVVTGDEGEAPRKVKKPDGKR